MELLHPTEPSKTVQHDSKGRKDFWGEHGREKSNSGGTWGWESIHPHEEVIGEGFVWEDGALHLHITVNRVELYTEVGEPGVARSDPVEVVNRGAERGQVGLLFLTLTTLPQLGQTLSKAAVVRVL